MLRWWFTFLLMFGLIFVHAQTSVSGNKKADMNYKSALEAYQKREYDKALELLKKAEAMDDSFAELYLLRADILEKQNKTGFEEAIERALSIDSLKYTFYYFVLGNKYYGQGGYEPALKYFRQYLLKDRKQAKAPEVRQKLINCDFALEALRTQAKQEVVPFISAVHDVYWPSLDITGKTVLYTEQEGQEENIRMLKDSCRYFLNLNTHGNEGTQSLTADGRMMYFTACGRRDGSGGCDIYVAYRLSDTAWSEPVNLGYPVNTEGWEAQPSISADGTRLYFASNREGGQGGSDIWFSKLIRRDANGKQYWSQPKCLYFNTSGDEMAPFLYYDNKTLFFSSDAYPGMGGKDIYKVNVDEVTEPLNIGITVNTYKDELGFFVDGTGKWGYFASDVSGKKSIYKYHLEDRVACEPASYIRLLTNDEQGMFLSPDQLIVESVAAGDTLAYYDALYAHEDMLSCIPANRLLLVSCMKKGYMYYSDTLEVGVADYDSPRTKEIVLQRIRKDLSLVLKGVFFDVDDYRLKPESFSELRRVAEFMKLNPQVEIEISGHTDDSGSAEHNYQLSESRAFEVSAYLFTNGVAKKRMTYKGYGKDKPKVPNTTEENRAINRRTEIRIR